ncbi:MAG: basic amino acid/polyamine antiporter [Bacteroidales bacterium]
MPTGQKQLGLAPLIAIVFSSMIGAGIYNIPQNMAVGAALGPTILSWIISGIGILFLVLTFKNLADLRPELNAGIYQYAQEGFGDYVGYNVAWGYWLCAAMGNVALSVMLNDSLGYFFPVLLEHGWHTVLFGSFFIWAIFFLIAAGVREAAFLNMIVSVVKILSISAIIVIMIAYFKLGMLKLDFWGDALQIGSFGAQIKSTMLVTLWCFIGVEGAVVIAERAKRSSDVGKATIIGFLLALVLYMLISILSFGILTQAQLAGLENPSVAYVLESAVGRWGLIYVILCVIVSILGGWIAWTILCVQVPFTAAQVKILPAKFLKENKKGAPIYSLLFSSILMQLFMIVVVTAQSVYMAAIQITGVMILPSYLFCGLYLVKISYDGSIRDKSKRALIGYRLTGILSSLFCLWLIYAGGLLLMLITSICYVIGIGWYIEARKAYKKSDEPIFSKKGYAAVGIFIGAAILSVFLLVTNKIALW